MRITRLEIRRIPPSWVWLLVHTDTEHVGLGEPYLEGQPEAVISEVERLEPIVVGHDPLDRERIWESMYHSGMGYRGGPVTMSAISGIDMALWDLAGKATGLSVAHLLGGRSRETVRMYRAAGPRMPAFPEPGHVYPPPKDPLGDDRDAWSRGVEAAARLGFRALKIHVHVGATIEATTQTVDRVIQRFSWARAAVGDTIDLALDVHDPHPVISTQIAEGIAGDRPLFLEEPVPQELIGELAHMTRATRVPIAAGERWMGRWPFFQAMCDGGLAVAQPDLAHVGGFTEIRRVSAIADATATALAPHSPLSPLALAATLQFDAWASGFLIQEHNEVNGTLGRNGQYLIGKGYLRDPLVLRPDGTVTVPDRPGLGVETDVDGLRTITRLPWRAARA